MCSNVHILQTRRTFKGGDREPPAPKPPACLFCGEPVLPADDAEGDSETGVIAHASCRSRTINKVLFRAKRHQVAEVDLRPVYALFKQTLPAEANRIEDLIMGNIWSDSTTLERCFLALRELERRVMQLHTTSLAALNAIRTARRELNALRA